MSVEVVNILQSIGYSDLKDYGKFFRTRPMYRDSDNGTVLLIDKNVGTWFDFKTREHGSLSDLVRLSINASSEQVQQILAGFDASAFVKSKEPELDSALVYSKDILYRLDQNHEYWVNRGIGERVLSPFLGGIATTGKMFGRYVFPIFDLKDKIIGFAGRDIFKQSKEERMKWKLIGKKTHWLYPARFNISELLSLKEVILVESIGDMLALWNAGIKNVLVTFGTSVSSDMISFLIKIDPNKIILAFNNDESSIIDGKVVTPGLDAAKDAQSSLLNFFDARQIVTKLPLKKDFGIMNVEEIISWKNQN